MPRCTPRIAFVLALAVSCGAVAANSGRLEFEQTELKNGLRVIALEDFSCPIVNVQLWYHVGSKDEHPERQGFAHMFEHMMFRGTDKLGPTDHFDLIRRTGGTCNAYTSWDQTVYHQTLPADQLELALWLEAERMAFLRIDQNSFDTERKVVEEERRLGLNRPYGSVPEELLGHVYKVHPYQWTPIGQIPHLRAAKVDELGAFWARYYVPCNATLVVAGAVPSGKVMELAEKYFAWMPPGNQPPRVSAVEPPITSPASIKIEARNAPVPIVAVGFRTVGAGHPDQIPLEMLATILGGGLGGNIQSAYTSGISGGTSSRLYRDLVAERQLAVFAVGAAFSLEQDGFFVAGAALPPIGSKPDEVVKLLLDHLERLRNEPVTEAEILKARNQMLKQLVGEALTVESKATLLGTSAVIERDADRANRRMDEITKVTQDDLLRVAKKYLDPNSAYRINVAPNLLGTLLGGKRADEESAPVAEKVNLSTESANPKGLKRPADFPDAPPVASPIEQRVSKTIATTKLGNSLTVRTVSNSETPFVWMTLVFKTGAWSEEKIGSASLCMQMLPQGAGPHSEARLAEEMDKYAIGISSSASILASVVEAECLSEHTERALSLMATMVREPTFPPEEFAKLKKRVKANLALSHSTPEFLAERELDRRLFGDHPYSRVPTGEVSDVDAVTVDDCRDWWRRNIRPDVATLIVAGDIDASKAAVLAESIFGKWTVEGAAPEMKLPAPPKPSPTQIVIVDRPGAIQSQIRIGQVSLTRSDSSYPTAAVVTGYFGGAFNARLNDVLRVKKGLTYGARGGFNPTPLVGKFIASTFTKTATTAEAVRVTMDELQRLRTEPPSGKELADTKSYLAGEFARNRETPRQIVNDIYLTTISGLPDDYFDQLLGSIAKTGDGDCLRLASTAIDPAHVVVVVVGEAKKIRADLEKIAPVTLVGEKATKSHE